MPTTRKPLSSLFLSLIFVLISGCKQASPGDVFNDYHERIARVQDASQLNREFETSPLPRKRELFISPPEISISLLDSYQLRQCGLFNLIAERNSVLGKVADEFRNFDYQVALIEGLESCLATNNVTKLDDSVVQQLVEIKDKKDAQLKIHKWNLLYTSQAMQSQLRFKGWINEDVDVRVGQVSDALTFLNSAILTPSTQTKTVDVQEVLERNPIIGDLNYSLANAAFQLALITTQLEQNDHKITCGKQRDQTQFRYLNNVFEQQYIEKVQPYMAHLDGYYQTLSPSLTLFSQTLSSHQYQFPIQDSHQRFRLAILDHVKYWQQIFQRCGRKLG